MASSPARRPEELAVMGLQKGYTTIVAVGGDAHINQIAARIIGQAVLGIIPINAGPQVAELIGTNDMKPAAEFLKFRRLTTVSTVLLEPETILFLDGEINSSKLAKISLVIDNRVRAYAYFNKATIHRSLELSLESTHLTEPKKMFGLFTVKTTEVKSESHFHGKSIRIVTDPELPITVAGKAIGMTPAHIRLVPESLKVITKRGTLG